MTCLSRTPAKLRFSLWPRHLWACQEPLPPSPRDRDTPAVRRAMARLPEDLRLALSTDP